MHYSTPDYFDLFNAMPGASGLVLPNTPEFTIVASTKEFAEFAGADVGDFIGSGLFRFFPDNPDFRDFSADIRQSLDKVIQSRQKNLLEDQRYDISNADGTFRTLFWKVTHTPILDEAGEIKYIIHTAENTTDLVLARNASEKMQVLEPIQNLFNQTNVAMHIFLGPDLIIEMANKPTLDLWGRDDSAIGKPLLEVLPELNGTKFPGIIRGVLEKGTAHIATEQEIHLNRQGRESLGYFNFVLQPYYDNDKPKPVGVIGMVTEVTDLHNSRIGLAEAERNFELASEIGNLGVYNIDTQTREAMFSPQVMHWFGFDRNSASLSEIVSKIYPPDSALVSETLYNVTKGKSLKHNIVFRVRDERTGEIQFLRSVGQLQMDHDKPVAISGIIQNITKSIQNEQATEDSAQRLRNLIASAPFPIGVYTGAEMKIEMVNQSIIEVWGKGPDVIGKNYAEVLPELAGSGIYESLERVFKEGISYNANNQRVDLIVDGKPKTFYFNYSFTPLFNPDGSVYGVVNTAADVTDLNLAKRAVEESENRYRTLIEESPVAAALYIGPDIKIQYANEIMLSYWGKGNSVAGKLIEDAVPELKGQPFIGFLKSVYASGKTYIGLQEKALLDLGNGLEEFYFNFTYKPLRDTDGNIYGIHHTAVDVTSEVLVRKALEESERNLRNMIRQAPLAICILWGEKHRFGNVNPMMEIMLGRTAAEIEGHPIFEAMPELFENGLQPILERALQGESFISEEQEFHLPSGDHLETKYIRYIYEPLLDPSGKVEGIMVVATDLTHEVTARRKIEEIVSNRTRELAEANQRLQQSNAELEQFAYIASHDLQEPLRKISMFTQLLESSLGQLNDKARHQMDRINNSVGRMTNLIRDILGYSQLSHKNDGYVPVDLNLVVKDAALDFELVLQEKNGKIAAGELPVIDAIPLQMVQLFGNLISNSLKYSRAEAPPEISIGMRDCSAQELEEFRLSGTPSTYACIVFQDNGIGFPQEYAERIFQIFQRLHGKTQYEGTGIGLAMCRKIAENHRGTLQAKGDPGKGAEFTIILPYKQ